MNVLSRFAVGASRTENEPKINFQFAEQDLGSLMFVDPLPSPGNETDLSKNRSGFGFQKPPNSAVLPIVHTEYAGSQRKILWLTNDPK